MTAELYNQLWNQKGEIYQTPDIGGLSQPFQYWNWILNSTHLLTLVHMAAFWINGRLIHGNISYISPIFVYILLVSSYISRDILCDSLVISHPCSTTYNIVYDLIQDLAAFSRTSRYIQRNIWIHVIHISWYILLLCVLSSEFPYS